MNLRYSASRILHDEHMVVLALLNDLERVVLARKEPPAVDDGEIGRFLGQLRGALAHEVTVHFAFEEDALFPVLIENGAGDLCDLLVEEHHVLRQTIEDVLARISAGTGSWTPQSWAGLRAVSAELVERLRSHAEKEEMALLPAMEEALTPETDAEACTRHEG
ncbi:MAG: hemerythrin domain-containing protein [Rhodoblastus sp.]|nr:hemerythrin domain-containing protein [Rhodoblastus sp.]